MTDATYDPNADPNYGIAPYNSANTISLVLHTDPTTGTLIFPTEILTGTFSSAAQSTQNTQSITNLVTNADPASNIILTGKSSSGVSINYSNLLTTLNTLQTKTDANNTYLTKTNAKNTYLAIIDTPTVSISTLDLGHFITISQTSNNYTLAYDNLLYFLCLLYTSDAADE